jgi:phage terminase large subunit
LNPRAAKAFTEGVARENSPGEGPIIFRRLQDHTADSIESLEGFKIAWVDETQTLSARRLALLRPTIRAENSELWASWNPRRKSDAIDDFLRLRKPEGAIIKANWRDKAQFAQQLVQNDAIHHL